MEGRCGHPTLTGDPCKRRARDGNPCALHSTEQCSVCFVHMNGGTRTLECGHTFHDRCLERWKRQQDRPTCPMCRAPFDAPKYRVTLSIQRVSDGVETVQEVPVDDIEALASEFDIQLHTVNANYRMDIMFGIDENEDLREVLNDLGIIHFELPI